MITKNGVPTVALTASWVDERRLASLARYDILDTAREPAFDALVHTLAAMLNAPMAAIGLIDRERQWFKSEVGFPSQEMPLAESLCQATVMKYGALVIPDTLEDDRVAGHGLVRKPNGVRFYAAEPLCTPDGVVIGSLCVLDTRPRPRGLSAAEQQLLHTLAAQTMAQLELRRIVADQDRLLMQQQFTEMELSRTQQDMREHRDYLRLLLDCTDAGFYSIDRDGAIVMCNTQCLTMLGYADERQVLGRQLSEVIHCLQPDGSPLPSEDCPILRTAATGEPVHVPQDIFTRYDGSHFEVEYKAHPVWRGDQLEGAVCTFMDITAHRQTEKRLSEIAQRLQFTLDCAQIGEWDYDLLADRSQRSLRHDQCFGYSTPVAQWGFSQLIDHVHPDDRERVARLFRDAVARSQEWHCEARVVWPDGSVHWIAAHGAVYEGDHRPARMSGIVFDITERKQQEAALLASERIARETAMQAEQQNRLMDALLEAAPVGIILAEPDGKIVLVNAANRRLWGNHPLSRAVGEYGEWKGWWADGSERHGDPIEPHEWALARALRGEEAPRDIVEIEPFGLPGTRRTILNSGAPVRDARGVIIGAVIAQMDITDRVLAENALKQADRRKDEFLAMLAHELRNPLAPISAAADLLSFAPMREEQVRRTSAVISRQVRHMTGLVDDLLDVSRVTRGLVKLERCDLDLKAVIADAIEQVRPLIEDRRHQLAMEIGREPAHVMGDVKRLTQVLTNVLNNAIKYTPEGGNIALRMEVTDGTVRLCIADDGIGMDQALQPLIFDLFAQAQRTSDRSQGGLGIGLALVKSLVQLHGGSVTCRSEGVGRGSEFIITLPRLQAPQAQAEPEVAPAPQATRRLRVLVVDDNVDAALMLAMLLEATGHETFVEHSARRALERAELEAPDVCVLDIGLPEMDGNELARCLRMQPQTASSILVAVTGYGQESDRAQALASGFDHHLVKPVSAAAINGVLEQLTMHLRGRRATDPDRRQPRAGDASGA